MLRSQVHSAPPGPLTQARVTSRPPTPKNGSSDPDAPAEARDGARSDRTRSQTRAVLMIPPWAVASHPRLRLIKRIVRSDRQLRAWVPGHFPVTLRSRLLYPS